MSVNSRAGRVSAAKTGLLFPGQGSHFDGMGQAICRRYAVARQTYQCASDSLGIDLVQACANDKGQLSQGEISNPAIVTFSIASLRILMEATGLEPAVTCGHSLGEISALVCADALEFEDAVRLAKQRAQLMAGCPPGVMSVVVGLPAPDVAEVCERVSDGVVVVATVNSPTQCVISGEQRAVEVAGALLAARSAAVAPLPVPVAAHSPLMESAVPGFTEAIACAGIRDPRIPVVSAVAGATLHTASELSENLRAQLTRSVNWPGAISTLAKMDVEALIDVGPRAVLRGITMANRPELHVLTHRGPDDLAVMAKELRLNLVPYKASMLSNNPDPVFRGAGAGNDAGTNF